MERVKIALEILESLRYANLSTFAAMEFTNHTMENPATMVMRLAADLTATWNRVSVARNLPAPAPTALRSVGMESSTQL